MSDSHDQNLLFGVLALQLDFITQDQLVAAANAWMVAKTSGLSEILVKVGALSEEDRNFVSLIVQKHVARSGSPKSSLDRLKQHELSDSESQVQTILHGGTEKATHDDSISKSGTTLWTPREQGWNTRFVRLRELASGGLGVVSVARDQELDREVALKEVLERKRLSSDAIERFVAEAKITGNLEHPGIVPIYGLGTTADGSPYYAMRLIRGRSLQEEIALLQGAVGQAKTKSGFKDWDGEHLRKLLRSLTFACNAVAYAHSRGVIHRDLKPSNIMLGKFGETIVVDWGLAKVTGETEQSQMRSEPPVRDSRDSQDSETVMGAVLGTPGYMSPEQAEGRIDIVDLRSDVFGLGACLYALLTNVAPFKGKTKAETIANARAYRLKPLREVDSSIPIALEAICMKAMAASPTNRYQHATELADDLDRWIAGEAITAMPDPLVQRVFRWARRHQSLVTGTAVLLLSALIALSIGGYLIREQRNIARRERDRANEAATERERQRNIAAKALVKATESNAVSLIVLEKFVDGLGDDGWAAVPQMESKRIGMVDAALKRFRELYAENPDDLDIKLRLARCLGRSANLYRMIGKLDTAASHLSECMQLVDTLNDEQLEQVGLSVVGDTLFALANLIEEQRGSAAAVAVCQHGIDVCRKRLSVDSDKNIAKLGLTMALMQLAGFKYELGDYEEAVQTAKAGQDLLYELAETNLSKQFFYPLFDILAFDLQAKSLMALNLHTDAEKIFAKARAVCEPATIRFPTDNNIQYFTIQVDRGIANLTLRRQQFIEGTAKLLDVIDRLKLLAAKHPDTTEYHRTVKLLYAELGAECLLNDEIAKAKEYSAYAMEGIDISKLSAEDAIGELKPKVVILALALAIAKREGEAVEVLQEKLQSICVPLKSSLPKCYSLQLVSRLAPEVVGK